jgi:glutaconyl-CoA/methylmalonyl-CoA decarboxylase subunit gamma
MIMQVKVKDRTYSVEILDLHARPIIASVDGVTYDVWPDDSQINTPDQPTNDTRRNRDKGENSSRSVNAPIPGVITTIFVRPGMQVAVGQQLCELEAMKMKNIIRASRTGIIGSIHVSTGQNVKYNELLMDYE